MPSLKNRFVLLLLSHLAALVAIALTTLALRPFQPVLQIQLAALIYLLPVMISTVSWGLTPGVLAAFFAFLAFNYFFIPPFNTLLVHDIQDLITLIIFLIVAVVMSQLIGQAHRGVRLARLREWEATRLYELTSTLAGIQDTHSVASALATSTLDTFQFRRVEVFINEDKSEPSLTVTVPGGQPAPGRPDLHLPLTTVRGTEGELRLWRQPSYTLTPEEDRLLETYIHQGALSLERIRLARGENKARVLEESDRLKSSLLNSVSHELRSPLAAIKASVSSLRSGAVTWDTQARQELLATIEEEADHLNLLVGNLLDMSRIEAGALNPQKRWNSIEEIAMGVVTKMRKQLQDHRLELDFPTRLPMAPTDYVMMAQVFTNLISNSVKYSPPDTTITLSAYSEAESLHVQVTNQGPPVPNQHLERIFDKFYRVTEADRVTGTGLGLSICKGIIEAHGGRIWAENEPCCFAFHFILPLKLNGISPSLPEETGDGKRTPDLAD